MQPDSSKANWLRQFGHSASSPSTASDDPNSPRTNDGNAQTGHGSLTVFIRLVMPPPGALTATPATDPNAPRSATATTGHDDEGTTGTNPAGPTAPRATQRDPQRSH